MAKEIKIPQISEGVDTATLAEILVSVGDKVEKDQSVVAVETDKATADVPSSDSGTVKEIKVKEGQEVKVGQTVIILEDDEGDDNKKQKSDKKESESKIKDDSTEQKKSNSKKETKSEKSQSKDTDGKSVETGGNHKNRSSSNKASNSKEVYASPGVRRIARELGVKLEDIHGSGEGGRITEKDVKNFQKQDNKNVAPSLSELPDFSKWGAVEREEMNNIKKTTAENVTESWQNIPHVFQFGEADISNIEEYIEKHHEEIESAGGKLTLTGILTKIIASALHQFPTFNASVDIDKGEIILKKYVNISIAVATDKGLLVPVIKDADHKNMKELSLEISEIAEKARNQNLSKEDMEGGNFSISNLGGIGGTNFTPIVYHPQVAILGVSQASTKAVYVDGEFKPRSILPLSLSYDHRVIDGADGAEFMDWIVKALEDPYEALLH